MTPKKKAQEIAKLAEDKKAKDLILLNIKKLSSIADYLFVCSAESERQAQAIAMSVEDGLKEKKERPLSVEGMEVGRWVLMDYGDVIAHIYVESVRKFYDLEGLWMDAERVEIKEKKKRVK